MNSRSTLRYAFRTLLKNPGVTATAVLSLALGIGANTAIFSLIDTLLLRDLPAANPQSLVVFGPGLSRGIHGGAPEGAPDLFDWRQFRQLSSSANAFNGLAAANSNMNGVYISVGNSQAETALASLVSGNYFDVLGLRPSAGRFFDASVDRTPNANPWLVLSYGFWQRRFAGSTAVIGSTFKIGDVSFTVLGIAPRHFSGTRAGEAPDFWVPLSMLDRMPGVSDLLQSDSLQCIQLFGRLKPGFTMARAQAVTNVIYSHLLPPPTDSGPRAVIQLRPGNAGFSGIGAVYKTPLTILMAVVSLVLLIACANVANLLTALGAKRRTEFALRFALGASRLHVIRQLLTESLLLSACSCLLGLLIASWGAKLLVKLVSSTAVPLPLDFELNGRVLLFALVTAIFTGIMFGIVPALRSQYVNLSATLKSARPLPGRLAFGRVLVAGQAALAMTLLVTAGLLLHSFSNLISAPTGFERENVLLFTIGTDSATYPVGERLVNLYRSLEGSVTQLPGVNAAAMSLFTFNNGITTRTFEPVGVANPSGARRMTVENFVSPGFFSALHIPLLVGRELNAQDTVNSELVAVVSESFARNVFDGPANALGKRFAFRDKRPVRIVGVTADVKAQSVREPRQMLVYQSAWQIPHYLENLAVRVTQEPSRVLVAIREVTHSVDPNLRIRRTTTLADAVSDSLVRERAIAQLSTFFAALALFLSAIGLYGAISFAVARRTSEIGVRMALGAKRSRVLRAVMKDAMLLAGIGIAIGLPLSFVAARQMQSMLYGLDKVDPWSILLSVAALTVVAAIAGYLPARRAASVDPMVALRYE